MNAVEKMFVSHEDSLKQFDAYRREWVDAECTGEAKPVEEILLPWAENKAGFYQMFGKNLILSKSIEYKRSEDEIIEDMERMLRDQKDFTTTFFARLAEELKINPQTWRWCIYDDDSPEKKFYYGLREAFNETNLVEARLIHTISAIIHNQKMQFAAGQKSMRAIGKVARALGLEQEFEKFRVAHSMVLNQAKLKGKLCLSIHPLDFATASDNESGWSSCMSWQESGSYRLGTVEMMTSPYVICAYLASDSVEMNIGDGTWPSKKWRAWVIATEDFIVVNRNYPYDNEDLSRTCADWVKEMASDYYATTYGEINDQWGQDDRIAVYMNYMYNDLGDNQIGCYATNFSDDYKNINVSGPAICMWCGNEIPYDSEAETGTLCCEHCSGRVRCTCCGQAISQDEICWGPDDAPYCECCYGEHFITCDNCGDTVDSDRIVHIVIPIDRAWIEQWARESLPEDERPTYYPESLSGDVCEDCLYQAGIDPNRDLDWDATMSFLRQSVWGSYNYWDGAMINPHATTWDKVAPLVNRDPDVPLYAAIWEHYCECVQLKN